MRWGKAEFWHCRDCGLSNFDDGSQRQVCPRCKARKGKERPLDNGARKRIRKRDGDRCSWPGCRATRNLEVHHIKWRHFGGTNTALNLVTLCRHHHHSLHPSMREAVREAAKGNRDSYKEYAKTIHELREQPRVEMSFVLFGIVREREDKK